MDGNKDVVFVDPGQGRSQLHHVRDGRLRPPQRLLRIHCRARLAQHRCFNRQVSYRRTNDPKSLIRELLMFEYSPRGI